MPIKHAAAKALRQNKKHRVRNLALIAGLRKAVKAVRRAATAREKAKAGEFLQKAIPIIDRARQKGTIKANTAARLKSRLHRAVRRLT
ncbi:MAG: 30S ribosomal protein S20 [Candidatus Kerfeldbacteria bacterium]|nr:30S ribosomal protein S20 [Candidatus Kerfeldbacteria bacterium]